MTLFKWPKKMFQLYFYVNLFNLLEISTIIHAEKVNKKTIEVLLNEIFSKKKMKIGLKDLLTKIVSCINNYFYNCRQKNVAKELFIKKLKEKFGNDGTVFHKFIRTYLDNVDDDYGHYVYTYTYKLRKHIFT